jgi:hypothetical protein
MGNPFRPDSPDYYSRLRKDLAAFRAAYVPYINRTAPDVYAGGPIVRDAERATVVKLAARAHRAVSQSGYLIAWLPPPVFASSTPPLEGLAPVAFAHENEAYRGFSKLRIPRPYEAVIDALDQADVILAEREEELQRRRRSPWYWVDRALRATLGIPAYLVSLIFGFDLREVSESKGRALWWFSLAADVATMAALGNALRWW